VIQNDTKCIAKAAQNPTLIIINLSRLIIYIIALSQRMLRRCFGIHQQSFVHCTRNRAKRSSIIRIKTQSTGWSKKTGPLYICTNI